MAMITRAVLAKIPNRAFLAVTGANTAQFLNGLVTTTVPWPPTNGFYSAFLHAGGKIQYDIFLWPFPRAEQQGYLIEYDPRPTEAPPLEQLLRKHILRSRVRLRDVSTEWDVWAAWGGESGTKSSVERQWRYGSRGAVEPIWENGLTAWAGKDSFRVKDLRGVGMGQRIVVPKETIPEEKSSYDVGTADDYTVHRFLHGIPEGSIELQPLNALPLNSNMDLMGGIDFRKGCYVGQELTVRTFHTGVIRKRIYPVQIYPAGQTPRTPPSPDPSISVKGSAGESASTSLTVINNKKDGAPERGSKPRLLNSLQGLGLATLRTSQVDGVEKGDLSMYVETPSSVRWSVRHWIPSWWPTQSIYDDGRQE